MAYNLYARVGRPGQAGTVPGFIGPPSDLAGRKVGSRGVSFLGGGSQLGSIRIFKHYVPLSFLLLGLTDFLVFYAAVYAGAAFRFSGDMAAISTSVGDLSPRALLFAVVMTASMMSMGLYQARLRDDLAGITVRLLVSFAGGGALLALLFYLLPTLFVGRGVLALSLGIAFLVVTLVRLVFYRLIDEDLLKRRVLVLGAGNRASHFGRLRRRTDQRGFMLLGFVPMEGEPPRLDGHSILHLEHPLPQYALEHQVDEIVVAVDDRRRGFPLDDLLACKLDGVDVIDVLTFFEREVGRVKLELLHPSWFIFSDGFTRSLWRSGVKRGFDILAALLLLAITWPVMLLTALAIEIECLGRDPVLYRQVRVGKNGHPFDLLKFRSMKVDAEQDGRPRWASADDDRVTRVGRFIRKTRIDELPQIFNVLRGQMSIVGPRPERPEFVDQLARKIPYYQERHRVKPGITGWAQLCFPYGASEEDAREKLEYDLYYVKNHSLMMDILILLQTAEVVLWTRGAR